MNPLHTGAGAAFSDAFLLLAIPVLLVMALSAALPRPSVRSTTGTPFRSGLRRRPPTVGWPLFGSLDVGVCGERWGRRGIGEPCLGRKSPQPTTANYPIKHQRKAWRGIDGLRSGHLVGLGGSFKNTLDRLQLLSDRDPPYLANKLVGLVSTAGGVRGFRP